MNQDAHEVYGRMAEGYADSNPHAPAREHYEWPAVRELIPDVEGKRVLDAACGPGYYSAWLAERGGEVVGVDASEAMIAEANRRYGDAATFRQGDLCEPLTGLEPGSFDLVVCQLALEHVEDWEPVMANFARLLDERGQLVVSTAHPFTTYFVIEHEPPDVGNAVAETADYYAVEQYDVVWGEGEEALEVPFFRRSLQGLVDPLFDVGFALEALREPTPEVDDENLAYFAERTPRFLAFRARKSSGTA
jgi:2-polyprenyl-3-methyl-5-hydroxy-6-metoxy-1,4-benzoquinol methylase